MQNNTQLAEAKPQETSFALETNSGSLMLAGGEAFAHIQRVAKMFSSSSLIPDTFKGNIANCTIALEMAHRMGANPMAVMQNLYIVHGKPGWSAQFIIACLNQCGKFSPIRFRIIGDGDDKTCTAWAKELESGETLEGPPVSIGMAKKEGWATKSGSKWQTMPDLMLRYRAATFFGRLYAPDLLMGMQSHDELIESPTMREIPAASIPLFAAPTEPQVLPAAKDSDLREELVSKMDAAGLTWRQVYKAAHDGGLPVEADMALVAQSDDAIASILAAWPNLEPLAREVEA
ncbi:MAG: hypothetical protein E6R03_11270 [Hyphomicrobiaceae bacterium]|nr:MAG: hypothetical protein E6R03_11270 [Hyphomicrobiaceae bacterium]